jgi:hypothetical protein
MDALILDQNTTQLRLTQGKPNILLVYRGETTNSGENVTAHNVSDVSHLDIRALITNTQPYVHIQATLSNSWMIYHNKGRKVSISVTDSFGNQVFGAIIHHGDMVASVNFTSAISGEAYCI